MLSYLLKPIAFDRFLKAVERFRSRESNNNQRVDIPVSQVSDHIYVNVNRTKHKILYADILYIESMKDYVRIHTIYNKLMVKGNLGSFMKKVPSGIFIRVHRSYAISLNHIQSYNQSEVWVTDNPIPVGYNYKKVLSEAIE